MGKVSNGVKSIGAEIVKLASEAGTLDYTVGGVAKSIELVDEAGNLLSTFDALGYIVEDFENMTELEQNQIALMLGMKTQIPVMQAIFSNWDGAVKALNVSMEANGSALEENEAYMESLSAKANLLKASFEQLVLGDGGLSSTVGIVLELSTAILTLANTPFGDFTIQVGLATTAIVLLNMALKSTVALSVSKWITTLSGVLKIFKLNISGAIKTTDLFKQSLNALGLNPVILALIAIAGAVKLATGAFDALNVTLEEQSAKLSEITSKLEEVQDEYDALNTKSGVEELSEAEKVRLKILEAQLSNLKEQQKIQAQQTFDTFASNKVTKEGEQITGAEQAKRVVESILGLNGGLVGELLAQAGVEDFDLLGLSIGGGYSKGMDSIAAKNQLSYIESQLESYDELNQKIEANNAIISQNSDTILKNNEAIASGTGDTDALKIENEKLGASTEKLSEKNAEYQSTLTDTEGSLIDTAEYLSEAKENGVELGDEYTDLEDRLEDFVDGVNESSDATQDGTDSVEDSADRLEELNTKVEESAQAYEDSISNLSDMDSAFNSLNSAVEEYNTTGKFSASTISDLLSLGSEYLSLLQFENGQVSLNEQGAQNLANAKIDEAQALAITNAQAQMTAIAEGNLAESMSIVAGVSVGVAQNLNVAGESAYTSGLNAREGAKGWEYYWSSVDQDTSGLYSAEQMAGLKQVQSSLVTQLNALEGLRGSIGSYTTALGTDTSGATGAVNNNTSALEKQKEALEEVSDALETQIDAYEIVIDYVKDMIDEEKEALEEEKDAVLDSIQEKIDALKEEQDALEENIDEKIDALEKEKDAFNELRDAEIESLEERIEAEEEYWDNQIGRIEDENDAIEENIKLQNLQEAVANAKASKVMVLKDGKFVYTENESAVSEAEEALADYERELAVEKHLAELEKLKEEALDSLNEQLDELNEYVDNTNNEYDEQIENLETFKEESEKQYEEQLEDLEAYYDEVEAEYDANLLKYEEYAEKFEDMLSASADEQAKILYDQLIGEQDNWEDRLDALGDFVKEYEAKQKELAEVQSEINSISNKISRSSGSSSGSSSGGSSRSSSGGSTKPKTPAKKEYYYTYLDSSGHEQRFSIIYDTEAEALNVLNAQKNAMRMANLNRKYYLKSDGISKYIGTYASGTLSIKEDEIALVGDAPNKELGIGAKYNKSMGIPMNLKKGTGIVPAKETSNLTAMLTSFARGDRFDGNYTQNSGTTQNISIDKLILEGVQNADDFAKELSTKFRNIAMQKVY